MDPARKQPRHAQKRGSPRNTPETRTSKTMSWILRHGALQEGVPMRGDGFVLVTDLLANARMHDQTFFDIEQVVKNDPKGRYSLIEEGGVWFIRANQGHSIKTIKMELEPLTYAKQVPMAVHGTNTKAWESIQTQGLSRMNRNHIHLAQGVPGDAVISGMRHSAQILIYIDLARALAAGQQFFISANGVVLCEGPIPPRFFARVDGKDRVPLKGWEGEDGAGREARAVLSEGVVVREVLSDVIECAPSVDTAKIDGDGRSAAPAVLEDGKEDALAEQLQTVELK
ncbi:hypothetical protein FIBSPDRAFT_814795 [Athelia psychrophila]|uniref:2'-phosphotransferase n=1 Tax=Athelia psychrophila TaxID=1759441 RepID=A0A166TDG7_9AGAM|nr:hypothetical protein FIBSPDRAFT_814795 [Fibularhizoctonia sp. CBS 109695]